MIKFLAVDVNSITSQENRSDFDAGVVEKLADSILDGGGLARPLVLQRSGLEDYSVISGHLEFYAAVRAREKDPRQGEMVNALIVTKTNEAAIAQQLEHLSASNNTSTDNIAPVQILSSQPTTSNETVQATQISADPAWISSFENRLSELREMMFQAQRSSDTRLTAIEKRIGGDENYTSLLDQINRQDEAKLTIALKRYSLDNKKVRSIVEAREQQATKTFASYAELIKLTKGLGNTSLLKAIDLWESLNLSD